MIIKIKALALFIVFIPLFIKAQTGFYDRNTKLNGYLDSISNITGFDSLVLNNYELSEQLPDGGASVIGYYHNSKLIKLKSWFGLSYGVISREYFLKNDSLFLVIEQFNGYLYDDELNGFNYTKFDISYNGWFVFKNNLLIDMTSLGHGRFEDDSLNPERILLEEFNAYKKKLTK